MPQSFRLAVQQLFNDSKRHFNSTSVVVSTLSVDALLNWLESTISTINISWFIIPCRTHFVVNVSHKLGEDTTVWYKWLYHSTSLCSFVHNSGILLNLETVDLLTRSGYTGNDITSSLQVSRTTLLRCLTEANCEIKRFTDISDDEVDSISRDCRGITPIVDSRVLKQRDVIVQRWRLRENTARTDLIHGHLFITLQHSEGL